MKIKSLILLSILSFSTAFAEQKVLIVPCKDGVANTSELSKMLSDGWRVVDATPVTDSDSVAFGKPKQVYTTSIVYIIKNN